MKKNKISSFLIIFCSLLGLMAGCADGPDEEIVISNVVRVLHHECNRYTFFTQKDDGQELQKVTVNFRSSPQIHFFADVPPNDKMWVKYIQYKFGRNGMMETKYVEIHLHSARDINGGGWNHGKFGSGMTTVIE